MESQRVAAVLTAQTSRYGFVTQTSLMVDCAPATPERALELLIGTLTTGGADRHTVAALLAWLRRELEVFGLQIAARGPAMTHDTSVLPTTQDARFSIEWAPPTLTVRVTAVDVADVACPVTEVAVSGPMTYVNTGGRLADLRRALFEELLATKELTRAAMDDMPWSSEIPPPFVVPGFDGRPHRGARVAIGRGWDATVALWA